MQWMTMTSSVPCHTLHAPQHAAALPFGPLNQRNDFFRPSYQSRFYIAGTGKSRYVGFCLELPSPRLIADQGLRALSALDIATQIRLRAIQKQHVAYTDSVNSYTEAVTQVSYVAYTDLVNSYTEAETQVSYVALHFQGT